jgi:4a-hydroxytetrahydrobiopterin dehydratase
MDDTRIPADEFASREGVDDWRYVLGAIRSHFRAGTFLAAADLVARIAEAAELADHHPDLELRHPDRVCVTLRSHTTGGVTESDVALARIVSELATAVGATADPGALQAIEIAIDTTDPDRIRPFWAAVLAYREDNGNLVDPLGSGPPVWFQSMVEPRTERNRFHIDVSVPHDQAEARIDATLQAGGRMVTDRYARSWWVLADADGNEACVSTWQDRSGTSG